jgi:hypothetical protein
MLRKSIFLLAILSFIKLCIADSETIVYDIKLAINGGASTTVGTLRIDNYNGKKNGEIVTKDNEAIIEKNIA